MTWLWNNLDLVLELTAEHARLSAIPILIGFAASLPLGWIASRLTWLRGILVGVFNVLYTIPSLALFVVLPVVLGTRILDDLNVVVALTIYAIAMMLRGTVDAFGSVSGDVLQSATAQGYSATSRFWRVQLPLAGPVLLANLRVVSVSTVSLLSVAALIGSGGLGYLFTNGFQRYFIEEIVIGIVFTVLLALLFDAILVIAGRLLMPWSRRSTPPTRNALVKARTA
ncbi:MAG: ABC transporter permease [Pseudolysinimonas sp.]|uniref:ABC transporter permease n=1 Tax=Pseudolysinimonas sp. TaxID=2680009 RepID=UPI003C78F0BB